MGLFGLFGKKEKKEETKACCCGGEDTNCCSAEDTACCSEDDTSCCGGDSVNMGSIPKAEDTGCCCGGNCDNDTKETAESTAATEKSVKVLGSGCPKCNALERAAVEALEELGMDTTIEHVTDFAKIASYGVMSTPALVVDGKVVSYGKVLNTEEVYNLIKKVRS